MNVSMAMISPVIIPYCLNNMEPNLTSEGKSGILQLRAQRDRKAQPTSNPHWADTVIKQRMTRCKINREPLGSTVKQWIYCLRGSVKSAKAATLPDLQSQPRGHTQQCP